MKLETYARFPSHAHCKRLTERDRPCAVRVGRQLPDLTWICHLHDPDGKHQSRRAERRSCHTKPLMNNSSLQTREDTLTRLRKQRLEGHGPRSAPPGRTAKLSSQIAEEASTSGGPASSSSCPPSSSMQAARPSQSSCSGSATGTSASTAKSSSTPSTASDTGSTCSSRDHAQEQHSGSSDLLGLQGPGDQPCARQSLDTALHCPMTPEQAKVVKRRIRGFGEWMDEEKS